MSEQRFERRRKGERRRRVLRVAVPVLALVVLGGLVWVIWFSSLLAVKDVKVEGLRTLRTAQVERVADVPAGRPMARLDAVGIEERLARISRVEEVEVKRSWPGTVRIVVTERQAVAWVREGQEVRAVDKYGVDYRVLAKEPQHLPEVRVAAVDARRRQQAFEAAAGVVVDLRANGPDVLRQVQHVEAATKDSVLLDLTKGREVMWG
ncbi:MAG: FtsQ-type POTRA domain-containing protein, partial [Actinomycetales bacterium]